ncbi:hypothetical protein TNCV_3919691 [Trichonephila clavipes]|nr:hypothetical protein TNCV_3919691 [Trichonephila clavipes]
MLQHQGEDPTGKPDTLICSTNPTAVSLRGLRKRYHQPIDRSGLTPATRLQRSVGQRSAFSKQQMPVCDLQQQVWPMRRRVNLTSDHFRTHWHQGHGAFHLTNFLPRSAVCYPTADSMIPCQILKI